MQNKEKQKVIGWPLSLLTASLLVCLWNVGLDKVVHFIDSEGYNYVNISLALCLFAGMIYPQIREFRNGGFSLKEFLASAVLSLVKFCYVLLTVSCVYYLGSVYYFMHFTEAGKIAERYRRCAMDNYCYEGIPSHVTYKNCQERGGAWHIEERACLYFIDKKFCQSEDMGQWEDFGFCDKENKG